MKFHELSVKRPIAVTMAVLIFVVIGLYSLTMLPIAMMPDMNYSIAVVITKYSNVGSSEVENLVTKTVESSISAVSGVKTISSQSAEGSSMVMIEFNNGTDMDQAVNDMKAKLELVEDYLPDGAEKPMVLKLDMNSMPVALMSVGVEGYDIVQTKKYVEDTVKSKIEAVDGVASVNVYGANDREIEVVVDPEKLFGYNMSLSDLVNGIMAQNQNLPAGSIVGMGKKMSIRAMGKFKSVKDLDVVPITTPTGQVIYLRDVASVKDGYSDDKAYSRLDGKQSLMVSVTKQSDANTVNVVKGITEALTSLKTQNTKLTYNMTMEQASYIEDAISSVAQNAFLGAFLAILILLLFLGSVRSSLIIGISMPVSIITTFIGMYFCKMSLNVVSLGGLALGVGMLVDNSVVVLENIFRRRKTFKEDGKIAGMKGAGEVVGAVIASVLTTCIVYVPILFINNVMAVMFKQLAFTIIFSQLASLIVTFLLVPMLSSKIDNVDKPNKSLGFVLKPFAKFLDMLYKVYDKTLRRALKHGKMFITIVLIIFVLSLVVLSKLGMTLMPSSDEGTVTVSIEMPEGTKLEDTNEMSKNVAKIISTNKDVKTVAESVGSDNMSMMTGATLDNKSSITVTLIDKEKRKNTTDAVADSIRKSVKNIAGAVITVEATNNSSGMSSDEISFRYSCTDDDVLNEFIKKAEKTLSGIDGVVDTSTSLSSAKPEVRVYVDGSKASQYGLTTSTAATLVNNAIKGKTASRYTESGKEYDIVVMYPDNYIENYNELKTLKIKTPKGQWVTLEDIANIKIEQGYSTLVRVDQKRTVTLTGKIFGKDMQSVKTAYEKEIAKVGIPEGVSQTASGSYKVMMDAMLSLLLAILLGIVLMYMVMAAQFESFSQPLIILFAVPLSMIGVVLSLMVTRSPLSVVGCIGILMLIGIVVNNAIVLIDFINTDKKENPDMERTEIIVNAGITRMRPVLMTTITSILGFLPMAVSKANGSEMMQPLAVVLLGGLLVGTLLTLYFIPVMYVAFDNRRIKRKNKKERKKQLKLEKAAQINFQNNTIGL